MEKSQGGKKMPETLTMGMVKEPYWEETWKLCRQLNIPPTEPIKEVLRKWMPIENEILKKRLDFEEELAEEKKKLEEKYQMKINEQKGKGS